MKHLTVALTIFLCTVALSAQVPPVDSLDYETYGNTNSFGGTLEFPVYTLYERGGPRVELPGVPEGARYETFPFDQVVGIGFSGLWQRRVTDDGRLRTAVTLGFRRQLGRGLFQWVSPGPGMIEPHAGGWMDHSIDNFRLGGELQVQPLRWGERTQLRESQRSGDNVVRSVTSWYGVVLRAGANGVWRAGSDLTMKTHPENVSAGSSSGYEHEPEPHIYYHGPIPGLEPLGLELLGGIALEFPISNQVVGSISAVITGSVTPVTSDDWGYRVIGMEASLLW
jgi:hypothetical protein